MPPSGGSSSTVPSVPGSAGDVTETPPSVGWRSGVFPTTRVEMPRGAIRPEGASATPDADLSADDLTGLLTSSASVAPTDATCSADAVSLSLTGLDAALGHRYAQVLARNHSAAACELAGWPGLGVRGQNGTAFAIVAERADPALIGGPPAASPDSPLTLAPGETAAAQLEWTGSLAGAYDEHASLIVVQFAAGQPLGALIVPTGDQIDIGPETTVRVGPWAESGKE